jgi:hypothetical protein
MVSWLALTYVAVCATLLNVAVEVAMNPVPLMVSACAVAPAVRVAGDRDVTVGAGLPEETVTVVEPDLVESCVEVAVIVAVPADVGVKTPEMLTLPMLVGLIYHVTEELKLPVPVTVGVQVDVWVVSMEAGEQATVTEVIVEGTATVTVA